MSAKKKAATKAKSEKPVSAVQRFKASAHPSLTRQAMWIQYLPGNLVRVNVQEVIDVPGGEPRTLQGHDVDIPIGELDADILAALTDALAWSAEELGAEVYEPPEPEEE